jgi:hypothetical protein
MRLAPSVSASSTVYGTPLDGWEAWLLARQPRQCRAGAARVRDLRWASGAQQTAAETSVQTGDNGASALAGPHHELAYQKRLAEGPPTPKGQVTTCSYNCHDYSEAIALRKEDWINGCRSGKQISRMLRNLY